ncbi:MAG: T9SS type A sorting domain-containing protein [Bacteroidales bacterium]|nr:T9SS type A sorting domain-containing protein [Bacteroidales bacterium]
MKNILFVLSLILIGITSIYAQTSNIFRYESALPSDTVTCIAQDAEGNVLLGTANGLVSYNGTDFSVINTSNGLAGNYVNDIFVASDGKIYVATTAGLSIRNNNTWQNEFTGGNIRKIAATSDGRFWYSTISNSVVEYNSGNTTVIPDNYGFANGISGIYVDRSDNVWISCNGNVVEICDNGKTKSFADIFSGKVVYDVYQRFNGEILAATSTGIMSYDYNSWTSLDGISGGVSAVCEDFAQNIIFGNYNGVYRYDGTSSTLINNMFSAGSLMASGPQQKRLWCIDMQNGIAVMDFNGNAETYHTNRTLLNHTPNFIYGDNNGTICIAGNSGINLVSDYTWTSYKRNLQNLTVKADCIHNDTLWLGTNNSLIRKAGRSISVVAETNVNALADDNGTIYAATDYGILRIVGGSVVDTIESASAVKDVVCSNGLFAIAGTLVYRIENENLTQVPINISNTNTSRFVKTASGNIFITTGNGIARFNPPASPATELIEPGLPQDIVSSAACDENVYVLLSNGTIYEYSTTWREVTTGSYTKIASAGNGILWAIRNDGTVERICINGNATFTISSQPETCDGSNNASLTISATGASSYSIDNDENWQTNGNFANISGGYKHLLAKDSNGKIIADSVVFVEYGTTLYNQSLTYVQPECYGETGNLALSGIGTSSFVWENSNTTLTERTNLSVGNYAVTITNSTCQRSFATTIAEKQQITVSETIDNLACNGDNSGRISLAVSGGTSPYSYTWNNDTETASIENLAANEYSCTVSDRNSCSVTHSYTVSQPEVLSAQANPTNITCYGANNGAISLTVNGGTPQYTYHWNDNNAEANRTNLPVGSYSVTITDNHNCSTTATASISQPTALNVNGNATNISCYGRNDGAISISVSGGTEPYDYQWNGQTAEANQTNLSAGNYSLVVTDANTCTATFSATITEPDELVAIPNISPITCAGANDAILSASATGGTGTYAQYFWFRAENPNSPVCVQPQYQNVAAGNYLLVVKDSHNCTDTVPIAVEDAVTHNFEMSVTDAQCNGGTGSIAITVDGGNGTGFSFAWSGNASSTNSATSLPAGHYTITATDSNDCEIILDTAVNEPEMPFIGAWSDIVLCEGQSYTLDAGNYTSYQWSNGATTQTLLVSEANDYSVTVTDNQGCRSYDAVNVSIRQPYTGDKLALASVSETNSVVLRWNKTANQGTASYRIYRDSGEGFAFIASVGFNSEAMYEDTTIDASEQYYSYKVTAVSNCGDESEIEAYHRTIVLAAICDNNNVCNLNWSPYVGITETFTYILAGDSPETLEVVDSVLFTTYNYVQMNQYEDGTYYRIMIKMSHPLVIDDDASYDRIYSNIVRCGGSDDPIDPIDPPVMAEEFSISDISAYPNPFDEEITVKFNSADVENVTYEVIDALGRIVLAGNANGDTIVFGSELKAGIYVVRLHNGNEVHSLKISKQ